MAKITLLPNNQNIKSTSQESLYDILSQQGIEVNAVCGGKGTCGKCKVEILKGQLAGERLADGTYLACKTKLSGDVQLRIPVTVDAVERKSELNKQAFPNILAPGISKVHVTLPKPSLEDQRPDWERLVELLPVLLPAGVSYRPTWEVLSTLPKLLREEQFRLTVVIRKEQVVSLERGDTTSQAYGMAFDVGTTSLVATLADLCSGNSLATKAMANPQRVAGADVISRIEYVGKHPEGGRLLQETVVRALNTLIDQLLEQAGVERQYLYEATVVGNTTMHHLLLGLDPVNLARQPYIPVVKSSITLPATEIGLKLAPGGAVHILPNIAGFVGSDTVGVILTAGIHRQPSIILAIDIGTNGEIALGSRDKVLVCSTAAGPAFEGAQISSGMRAADGAIEGISIDENGVDYTVIGDARPILGICGSGLIQVAAEMLKAGIIDETGRLKSPEEGREKLSPLLAARIESVNNKNVFIIVPENDAIGQKAIYITQKDIRELQLAKGAIAAGIKVLMQDMNISPNDIEQVILAGAFGSYIDRASARLLGLIPPLPLSKVKSAGNAAGQGALFALLSLQARQEADQISTWAKNIELSARHDFQEAFVESMAFRG